MTFYFYDLETTGVSPRNSRVMQFAGQRTDEQLNPIGEPDNILIKITPDILPEPEAILITKITPQQTLQDGISEAEFLKYFVSEIATANTTMVGFNNIRFDDEFMRFMLWRNFYDAYEWQWKDGSSRWDLLDMIRMTRALRPDKIKWPFSSDGKPTNRLELLSSVNKLAHSNAHDALSDVTASIEVARLVKLKQPKLFDYLLNIRGKAKVSGLVNSSQPFLYTSGRYPSKFLHTTIVAKLADHPDRQAALVYDLRTDPDQFVNQTPEQLAELWGARGKDAAYFPVKSLVYNRAPAIAPLSVLNKESAERLEIDNHIIENNLKKLNASPDSGDKIIRAWELMKPSVQPDLIADPLKVDEQLYDGFISDADKTKTSVVRAADSNKLADLNLDFADNRLSLLLPLYKARNYPRSLTSDEQEAWENFRKQKLLSGGESSLIATYFEKLNELAERSDLTDEQKYLLEELNLYGQSITPVD